MRNITFIRLFLIVIAVLFAYLESHDVDLRGYLEVHYPMYFYYQAKGPQIPKE